MSARVRFAKGGEAVIAKVDGDHVKLSGSTTSAPPGAYVDAALDDGTALRVKVRGCRKVGEAYEIEGRFVDFTRGLREKLAKVTP